MTLEVRQLTYTLNERSLIKNISLMFQPGALYGILGPNGSGKSTLLKSLSRVWTPTKGHVFWNGEDVATFSRKALSQIISLVPQNPQLFFDFDAYTMVAMGRYPYGSHCPKAHQKIEQALRQVNAWHLRDQHISQLSGGERQRIYIARAITTEAPILLLDEPTSHLDLRHQLEIWHLLRTLVKGGKLIIIALHDLLTAQRFCDRLVVLHHGQCQTMGSYAEVMTPDLLHDIFGVNQKSDSEFELSDLH